MNKDIEIDIKEDNINIEIDKNEKVYVRDGTGTSNYNDLINKPQINGVPLEGNKTLKDLGIKQEYTANDIAFVDGETFQQKYDNGELKGDKGDTGANGQNGENGQDGFSPTVTTTPISNGTKVSITDKTGTKEFGVMNGEKGLQGEPGTDGKTPVKGVDYFTETDKQEFIEEVEQTLTPELDNKLNKNQGAENSGKFLGIGADGLVVPKDVPSTGGGSGLTKDTFGEILIAEYTHEGNQEIHFSEFDWETCIGTTTEPHELSEATPVQVVPNNWVSNFSGATVNNAMCSVPIEWMMYNGVMYLLPLDENRVQVVKNDKSTPITVNPDDTPSNDKINFSKFHFEISIGMDISNLDTIITSKKIKVVILGAGSRPKGNRYLTFNSGYYITLPSVPAMSISNNIYQNFVYKIEAVVEYGNVLSPISKYTVQYISQSKGYNFFVAAQKEQSGFILTNYLGTDKTINRFRIMDQSAFLTNGTTVKIYALEGEYNES